jgi:hypothetical protein
LTAWLQTVESISSPGPRPADPGHMWGPRGMQLLEKFCSKASGGGSQLTRETETRDLNLGRRGPACMHDASQSEGPSGALRDLTVTHETP